MVHIIHAADGNIPSDMAITDEAGIDEERRLFYVAMTRAKDRLYVYFPLRYYRSGSRMGDKHQYAQLTRFISPEVRAFFAEELPDVPRRGVGRGGRTTRAERHRAGRSAIERSLERVDGDIDRSLDRATGAWTGSPDRHRRHIEPYGTRH